MYNMYIKVTRLDENIYKRLNGREAKQTQHTLAGIPFPGIFVGGIFTIFTVRPLELLKSHPSKHTGNKVSPEIIPPENDNLLPFNFSLRY